jgi:NAD-dependent dihydropyrimidine dehydrogenase PreA subunit
LDGLIFGDLSNFFALKKRCKACEEMHPKQVIAYQMYLKEKR